MRRFLAKTERLVDSASLFSANLAAMVLLVLVVLLMSSVAIYLRNTMRKKYAVKSF